MLKILEDNIHNHTKNKMNQKITIRWNIDHSLYVGDAAGRLKSLSRKADFSCSDRKFAYNVGVEFQTPEEFFLKEKRNEKWEWGGFDPTSVTFINKKEEQKMEKKRQKQFKQLEQIINDDGDCDGKSRPIHHVEISIESENVEEEEILEKPIIAENEHQEMILLVGPPSCGKSTFSLSYFPNYVYINMDTLNTKAKCLKTAKQAISEGKSIIVDNTNPSKSTRQEYIKLGQQSDNKTIGIRCAIFDVSKDLAQHLNVLRVKMTQGKRKKIPTVAYNTYYKNFEEPTKEEGIDEIIRVPFTLRFVDELHRHLFFERT